MPTSEMYCRGEGERMSGEKEAGHIMFQKEVQKGGCAGLQILTVVPLTGPLKLEDFRAPKLERSFREGKNLG
jgi:hypothetical protein